MPDTSMEAVSIFKRPHSDMYVARLLASACIFLYLTIFTILFFIASSHGASPEKMIGLELPDYADTTEYRHLADSMINDRSFAISPSIGAEYARVPGYPAFFVIMELVFGTLLVVPFVQIAFTAATLALIYLIGARYFPRKVAIAAAVIYMIDPIVMYAAWIPISDSLFIRLFFGSLYAIGLPAGRQGTLYKRTWVPYIVAGVLFALSIYVRPVGLYLAPIIAGMAFALALPWKIALRNAAIFLFTAFLIMSPWMMRNYLQTRHFEFSSARAWQFYAMHMALFEQARTGVSYEKIREIYSEPFGTSDEKILRQFAYVQQLDAISKEKILEHPFLFAMFYLAKSAQLFVGSSIVNVTYHMHQFDILEGDRARGEGAWGMLLQHRWRDALVQTFTHIPRLVERIGWVLVYCSAIYAAFVSLRRRSAQTTWIICAFLLIHAYALMIGTLSDDTRYRMPIEPFLLLLGVYGAHTLWPRMRKFLGLYPQT